MPKLTLRSTLDEKINFLIEAVEHLKEQLHSLEEHSLKQEVQVLSAEADITWINEALRDHFPHWFGPEHEEDDGEEEEEEDDDE